MYSKIERSMFKRIVLDTLNCVPIAKTAAEIDLSIPAVFENRHKVLCALRQRVENTSELLSGTVEIDETYLLESCKGRNKLKRKARRRGEPSNYGGISREQVCIVTTTDRNGHEIFKPVGFGKPTTHSILENFTQKIAPKSIIYSDGAFSYDELAKQCGCNLVQLKGKSAYNNVEHINTVNCIHSLIKMTMARYRGVATKYLNRYMDLFVYLRKFQSMDDNEKLLILLREIKEFRYRNTRNTLKSELLFFI